MMHPFVMNNFTQACFLPYTLGRDYNVRSLVAKVLIALKDRFDITPATQHAASQLLLRIKYLVFVDTDAAQAGPKGYRRMTADCCLDSALVTAAKHVVVAERVRSGVPPRADIFNRGVIRSKSGGASDDFPSALHAVQELSFGSTKVRHVDAIDDILIGKLLVAWYAFYNHPL